ncbi:GNAT family N-acetyltransferase [Fodinibius sp. SL11]|uniref:GNAT family N-acetyltransferase n=1 Tax=Fodinibius sp. SL11 TaxID=3425690 RepID=UPI003F881999
MEIRLYQQGDIKQVAQLLGDSVSILNAQGFSETEMHSFAPDNIHFKDWEQTCMSKFTVVAESNNRITGIGQIDRSGHISCFYCHPDYRGQGIGKQLYKALEEYAAAKNITTIHTETSALDRPFYFKMGFSTVQKQKILLQGEIQSNFVIEKQVPA